MLRLIGANGEIVLVDPKPMTTADGRPITELMAIAGRMPELERQAFTLRKVDGYTQAQIAERLGVTEQQIEDAIARALRVLMAGLDDIDHARARAARIDATIQTELSDLLDGKDFGGLDGEDPEEPSPN